MKTDPVFRATFERYVVEHPSATYRDIAAAFKLTTDRVSKCITKWKLPRPKLVVPRYDKQKIVEYLSSHPDTTYQEVKDVFGCERKTVYHVIKDNNLPKLKHPCCKYNRDEIESYLLDHPMADYRELARVFRGSPGGVRNALIRCILKRCQLPRLRHPQKKYYRSSLEAYLSDHPHASAADIARHFNGTKVGVYYALRGYGLVLKNRK